MSSEVDGARCLRGAQKGTDRAPLAQRSCVPSGRHRGADRSNRPSRPPNADVGNCSSVRSPLDTVSDSVQKVGAATTRTNCVCDAAEAQSLEHQVGRERRRRTSAMTPEVIAERRRGGGALPIMPPGEIADGLDPKLVVGARGSRSTLATESTPRSPTARHMRVGRPSRPAHSSLVHVATSRHDLAFVDLGVAVFAVHTLRHAVQRAAQAPRGRDAAAS